MYSIPCSAVNIIANIIVYIAPYKAPLLLPCIKEWCEYVIVTPEDNKITVFNNGNSKGFIESIPIGGHFAPNSIVGDKALWKNAQKMAKKNKASDAINKATPILSPFCTAKVWFPKYVPSDITSLNHNDIDNIKAIKAKFKLLIAKLKFWNAKTALNVNANKDILVLRGQGLGDTKWYGCDWKLLRIEYVIIIIYICNLINLLSRLIKKVNYINLIFH